MHTDRRWYLGTFSPAIKHNQDRHKSIPQNNM